MYNIPVNDISLFCRMIKFPLILLFVFISGQFASAQYFERVYPGLNMGSVGSMDNTIDSGFIICGTQDGGFLLKIDQAGNIEWTSRDSGNVQQSAAVIQSVNGNFIVIGSAASQVYNSEAVVAYYDLSGDPISHFRIPPPDGWGSSGTTIVRSPDRSVDHYCYYVDGNTSENFYLLDNQDIVAGDMTYVGLNSISVDNLGNYYTAGNLQFDLDSLFTWHNNVLVFSSNYLPRTEYFYDTDISSAAITSDGGALLAGLYDTLGTKFLRLMKFDMSANLLWDTYIADSDLYAVNQVTQTSDGGYGILCTKDDGNNQRIAFIKADATGMQSWKQEFIGNGSAIPKNFVRLDDGYAILGTTMGDPYMIRMDSVGRTNSTGAAGLAIETNRLMIYPNPSNGIINLSLEKSQFQNLSITDLTGREVYQQQVTEKNCQLNLSFLARGVYQIRFTAVEAEPITGRFVIE